MSRLSIRGLHAQYGKSRILHGVEFDVASGEMVALLGRNGSGRSTAMKAVMGLLRPSAGSVVLDGCELAGSAPHVINRAGIAYVPEERLAFDHLTVHQNLEVGLAAPREGRKVWTIDEMYGFFPQLRQRRHVKAGSLSGGEQQMLTICRSLLGHPAVILIDEPTEGLAPKIVEHLAEVMQIINRSGVSVVLVEQKMTIALRLCRRCLIMGHGQIAFDGTAEELQGDPAIRREWLEVA